jgi:hypothetical protein
MRIFFPNFYIFNFVFRLKEAYAREIKRTYQTKNHLILECNKGLVVPLDYPRFVGPEGPRHLSLILQRYRYNYSKDLMKTTNNT